MTTSHHPLCDDNGWDHPGECVVETDFYALDESGPYPTLEQANAHDRAMIRPNVLQLLAAAFDVDDAQVCITYRGTEPETVTIDGTRIDYERALQIGEIT